MYKFVTKTSTLLKLETIIWSLSGYGLGVTAQMVNHAFNFKSLSQLERFKNIPIWKKSTSLIGLRLTEADLTIFFWERSTRGSN